MGPATWENLKNSSSVNCTEPPDTAVIVSGVTVVAIDTFDETHDGKSAGTIYVEDTSCGGKPYSGIQVFNAGFSPPNLRLAAGDVVDMNGNYEEFIGPSVGYFGDCQTLPEFTGTLLFRFDSLGLPTPVEITVADMIGYDNGRRYLGMLVRVKKVTLSAAGTNSEGRFHRGDRRRDDRGGHARDRQRSSTTSRTTAPRSPRGRASASVTGIVTYFYKFHISPRSPADFVPEESSDAARGTAGCSPVRAPVGGRSAPRSRPSRSPRAGASRSPAARPCRGRRSRRSPREGRAASSCAAPTHARA